MERRSSRLTTGPSPDEAERVEPHGYVDRVQQSLWKIHTKARDKMAVASTRQKTQYDLHIFKNKYTVGTPVWLNVKIRKKGLSPKLQDRWEGPYLIIGVLSGLLYTVQKGAGAKNKVVHHDRLKPFQGEFTSWL
ncbi:Hypothetical predicted protein [Mytilus galloprovincialis]|uniref:Integrase p58-like C-terminal domain-containing protein n=1 Tax=Mytilus galloprovincialis TaxID=29158 RepID=A0A8B6C5H0_MYTGA|nr:Hypothetical predicted protein [Mytilus galloprovincialis]